MEQIHNFKAKVKKQEDYHTTCVQLVQEHQHFLSNLLKMTKGVYHYLQMTITNVIKGHFAFRLQEITFLHSWTTKSYMTISH